MIKNKKTLNQFKSIKKESKSIYIYNKYKYIKYIIQYNIYLLKDMFRTFFFGGYFLDVWDLFPPIPGGRDMEKTSFLMNF